MLLLLLLSSSSLLFLCDIFTNLRALLCQQERIYYLMTHSTHFIYGCMTSDMDLDYSDNKRGNLLPPLYGLLFQISKKGLLYTPPHCHKVYTCCVALAGTRNSSMGSPRGIDPARERERLLAH